MTQTIIQVGNSIAITIPKSFAQAAKLHVGDHVDSEFDVQTKYFLFRPVEDQNKGALTPEFFDWLETISKKYDKTIKALAKV